MLFPLFRQWARMDVHVLPRLPSELTMIRIGMGWECRTGLPRGRLSPQDFLRSRSCRCTSDQDLRAALIANHRQSCFRLSLRKSSCFTRGLAVRLKLTRMGRRIWVIHVLRKSPTPAEIDPAETDDLKSSPPPVCRSMVMPGSAAMVRPTFMGRRHGISQRLRSEERVPAPRSVRSPVGSPIGVNVRST